MAFARACGTQQVDMAKRVLGAILIIYGAILLLPGAFAMVIEPFAFMRGWNLPAIGGGVIFVSIAMIWLGSRMRRDKG